jgi:hypothetical protein
MACYSSTLKPLVTGGRLGKSSDSTNLSTICATSASKSPIWEQSAKEYRKPKPHQRGGWNLLILNISQQTSMSSLASRVKEEDLIEGMRNSGAA